MLIEARLDPPTIEYAAVLCAEGASPLPETGDRTELIEAAVREVLEQLTPDP